MSIFTKNGKSVSFWSLSWKERAACVWLLVLAGGVLLLPVVVVGALGLGALDEHGLYDGVEVVLETDTDVTEILDIDLFS